MNAKRKIGWFLLICSALGATLLSKLDAGSTSPGALSEGLALLAARPEAPWLAFSAIALGGLVVFPAAPALLFAGALLGDEAYIIAFVGMLFSCSTGYWIGRMFVGKTAPDATQSGKMMALIQKHGAAASVLGRFVPGVPYSLQNLMLGSARVSWWPYLAGSALGSGVITVIFVSAGMAGAQALTQLRDALHYGWVVPGVGALAGVFLLFAKTPPAEVPPGPVHYLDLT